MAQKKRAETNVFEGTRQVNPVIAKLLDTKLQEFRYGEFPDVHRATKFLWKKEAIGSRTPEQLLQLGILEGITNPFNHPCDEYSLMRINVPIEISLSGLKKTPLYELNHKRCFSVKCDYLFALGYNLLFTEAALKVISPTVISDFLVEHLGEDWAALYLKDNSQLVRSILTDDRQITENELETLLALILSRSTEVTPETAASIMQSYNNLQSSWQSYIFRRDGSACLREA